ncbi:MAG: non-ribosomal peptide synthetase, partial [Myxococcaceae bacterium]|nr:non-ribosomal peptide synthetase [Myxococcaceae bacterium]
NERMTDAFDRASTLNFTTVAHVQGATDEAQLQRALRQLEARHPLLRAGIARAGKRSHFIPDGALPIPLIAGDGPLDAVLSYAEQTLSHRVWDDAGPRAELRYLRHGPDDFSLLLCLHHVVSDGSSGILAMRDLLSFLSGEALSSEPVPSPGLNAFFPRGHGGFWSYARALAMIVRSSRAQRPRRLYKRSEAPFEQRTPHIHRLRLSREDSLELARRARTAGATVHGVLCAATAQAVREQLDTALTVQRVLHPVCLRRYLRELDPALEPPREAVGCYVSSLETDHQVGVHSKLATLAREISDAIKRKKAAGVPLLSAPIAGPLLTDRLAKAPSQKLRELAEDKLMLNTFSLTNLGKLEQQLGVRERFGALWLEDLYFVAAGSILGSLGGAATSYRGELSLQLVGVSPLLAREQVATLAAHVETMLLDYARTPEALPAAQCLVGTGQA